MNSQKDLSDFDKAMRKRGFKVVDPKSGITEFDTLVMDYQAGDITFDELCSRLWNTGYKYGKKEALESKE